MFLFVGNRCQFVVEKFLSLNLEDKDLDVQRFLKEELLPSAGDLLNRSWMLLALRQTRSFIPKCFGLVLEERRGKIHNDTTFIPRNTETYVVAKKTKKLTKNSFLCLSTIFTLQKYEM